MEVILILVVVCFYFNNNNENNKNDNKFFFILCLRWLYWFVYSYCVGNCVLLYWFMLYWNMCGGSKCFFYYRGKFEILKRWLIFEENSYFCMCVIFLDEENFIVVIFGWLVFFFRINLMLIIGF